MATGRVLLAASPRTRRVAASVTIVLAVSLAGAPGAALGAGGVATTAQAVRGSLSLLNGLGTRPLVTRPTSWTTGGPPDTAGSALNVANPLGGTPLLGTNAVSATSQAAAGGGTSSARVDGLSLLGASTLSAGMVASTCLMTSSGISGGTDVANLRIGNAAVNPGVNSTVGVTNVLTGTADHETATYDTSSHQLVYTVRGLDLNVLGGLSVVASGSVVVAESVCTGTVNLGGVATGPKTIIAGRSDTPTVTVANSGDVAAPNTTISVPAPPTGYTIGAVTTTGGGSCAGVANGRITCTGVTVPGNGAVTVSLPTTIDAGPGPVADWTPAPSSITAVSTPVAALTGTRISAAGAGPLVTAQPPHTTGSTVTITPASVPAGRSATTTISVSNAGPSDATGASLTIPIGNAPDGLSADVATVGGRPCTVGASISCTGLSIPAGGSVSVSVTVTATAGAPVGTVWDLTGLTASVNDFTATGQGRLATVTGPDVNLSGGVTVTGVTAVPGGDPVTVGVRVANAGTVAATGTTVTVPAPPAGYTIGAVTSSGGGTCTGGPAGVRCTGVTVPAGGSVTVTAGVSLAAGVTAHWSAVAAAPVTATSGDSTGRATGRLVTADPRWTLDVASTGPAPNTTGAGDTTTITVTAGDHGPSDAVDAGFAVVAHTDTTFLSFDGTAAPSCRLAAATLVTCSADIPAAGTPLVLRLSVKISGQADPSRPLDDGCVSLDGDTTCGGPADEPLSAITVRTGLNRRLTVTTESATVTPGRDGLARLRLTSTTDESNLTVRIPVRPITSGYSVTAGTSTTGGRCTTAADAVTCTGVTLTAGAPGEIRVRVALDASVEPPSSWPVTGITVTDGTDTVSVNGTLAVAGTPISDVTGTFTGPDDHTVPPGGTTELDVTLHNAGPSDANQTTVVVLAPESTTFDPPTGDAATSCVRSSANTRAVCTLDLGAGADSPRLAFPITVSANADPSRPLDGGCLDLDAVAGCGGGDVPLHAIVLLVPLSRQLSIETTAASLTPGTSGDATIALTAGPADVDDLTVTVPLALPGGLTVETVTTDRVGAACTADAGQVQCRGLDIAAGDTATITLHLSAASAADPGTTWTAGDIAISRGPERYTVGARLAVVAAARYTLRTVYVAPGSPIPPGGSGTFEVDVYNDGPSDVDDTTISILAPDGGTFEPPDSTYSSYCRSVSNGSTLVCRFGLPAGPTPLRFRIVLDVSPAADPSVPLDGGCVDRDNDGVCGPDDPVIGPFALDPPFARKLDISTAPAVVGRSQTGTATVLLTPTEAMTGLTVTIPLTDKPADIAVGAGVAGSGGSCRTDPDSVTCTGVDVPAGGATIAVPVTVGPAAPDTEFWATDAITVSDGAGGTATGAGVLVRVAASDYTLTADVSVPADRTVPPGGTADVTVVVTDQGPGDVSGGLITVLAPYRTGFGDLGDSAQYCRKQSTNRLSCRVTLARDASISLRVGLVVATNADVNQHITGGCLDMDGDGRCRIGFGPDIAIPDIVLRAGLSDTLTVSATTTSITPGDDGTTTLTVHSSVSETDMVVSVDLSRLPAGIGVIGASRSDGFSCTAGDGTLRCPDVDLPAGGDLTVTLRAAVPADADPGTIWQPAITLSIPGDDYTRGIPLITVGPAVHDVTVTVRDPGTLTPGGTGTVTVIVHNAGPSLYRDARFEFEAPTNTTFGTPRSAACGLTSSTHVSCTLDVPVGDTELLLVLIVPPTANPGTPTSGGCRDVDGDRQCTYGPDQPWPPLAVNATFADQVTVTTEAGTATPGTTATGYVVIDATTAMTGLTVVVPERLPAGFTLTGASGPSGSTCDLLSSATTVTCTNVDVAAGRQRVIALTVDIAPSVRAGRSWTAYSITVSDGRDGSTEADGALAISGPPVAPISYTVNDLAGTVAAGRTVTLTVVVHNAGPSDADDVTGYVVAPANTTFGGLSGEVAADCSRSSETLLACDFDMPAGGGDITWVIPIRVSGAADSGHPVTGGCVSENDADCDDSTDHDLPAYATGRSLSEITSVAYTAATIVPGDDGTAQIVISATSDVDDLTFSVPLTDRPDEFTLTSVDTDTGACTVHGTQSIGCTGITLAAGASATITAHVSVDASLADPRTWRVVGAVLTQSDGSDSYTSSGLLVSTTAADYDIGLTWGAPTVNPAAPGQALVLPVRLHNNGPSDARGYPLVLVLPPGLNHGALPPACGEGSSARIVNCAADLDAGDDLTLRFAVVVSTTAATGSVLTACLDNVGQAAFDDDCGDSGDLAAAGIQVTSSKVDLQIHYLNPAPRSTKGGTIRLGLPYRNNGTETADDVTFTIDPPDGVRLIAADVLADASGFDDTSGDGPSPAETDPATCTAADGGDDNTVVCTGPAVPVGTTSQLWMTLFVSPSATAGTYPVTVEISTTSPEGDVTNNFATAQMTIASTGDDEPGPPAPNPAPGLPNDNGGIGNGGGGGGGDNLPRTGPDVAGLIVLSFMLVAGGVAARIVARHKPRRRPVPT